jgi:hypothetical protein
MIFKITINGWQYTICKILVNYVEIDILSFEGKVIKGFTFLAPMNPITKVINWTNVYEFPFPEELKILVGKFVKLKYFA